MVQPSTKIELGTIWRQILGSAFRGRKRELLGPLSGAGNLKKYTSERGGTLRSEIRKRGARNGLRIFWPASVFSRKNNYN